MWNFRQLNIIIVYIKLFSLFQMSAWANSKFVPGQFTGSTGASILSSKELASGFQAWAKRVSSFVLFIFFSLSNLRGCMIRMEPSACDVDTGHASEMIF